MEQVVYNWPKFLNGMSCPAVSVYETIPASQGRGWLQVFYINADRHAGRHVHVYEEYGLVAHQRCKVCGRLRERPEQPATIAGESATLSE